MKDLHLKPFAFAAIDSKDLRRMIRAGHEYSLLLRAELQRRKKVAAGDYTAATPGERLCARWARWDR